MTQPLIECIPNFSEARRPEVVDSIIASIQTVPGVTVLDRHSDMDHNRTVITMVGKPGAVEEAAFQAIKTAKELIDLNKHEGAHPRIGATDVVPFVPITETTMVECIEIARRLGKRVGEELSIPVYLYEEAATTPDRQNLENIRKGQYEGLREEIASNPERRPDFGPSKLGSAGATVIGARAPLIAFNVYLNTSDLSVAQKIAKAIRNSSGGLRYVKGMGVMVEGLAQVSMNLTNYKQTPIARVVEMVRREAARYGVGIHHCELVGLIPQAALVDAAVWYTQLDEFEPDQILESKLFSNSSSIGTEPTNPYIFLDTLASENPVPGGGAAAAFTAAEAAALVAMVGRVTVGKKKYAHLDVQMWEMIEKAESLRTELTSAVDEDSKAFDGFMQAIRLPRTTEEEIQERTQAMENAALAAASVPHKVAGMAMQVLELSIQAAEYGNLNAISDAVSASNLAIAAIRSASLNVLVNIKTLNNRTPSDQMSADIDKFRNDIQEMEKRVSMILLTRAEL